MGPPLYYEGSGPPSDDCPLSLPFRRLDRRAGAFGVAARLARLRDKAPVLGAEHRVAASPGVGARRGALGLRIVALLEAHAGKLVPQARIARLDAKRALERRRGVGEPARSGIGARAVQQAGDGDGLGASRGLRLGSGCRSRPGGRSVHGRAAAEDRRKGKEGSHRTLIFRLFSAYFPNKRCSQLFACCFTCSTAAPTADAHGARSTRADPSANGSSTAPEQAKSARNPLCGSISTLSMPSGLGRASGSGLSAAIISPHTGSAAAAPERRAARLSS